MIHRGNVGAGHYFAFIRPTKEDNWYEFNDSSVTPIVKGSAFAIGSGGCDSTFEFKDGRITEKSRYNNTSAYMLVYIRDCDRDEIMREIQINEIPPYLKERFDEENKLNAKLVSDWNLI